ncbi:MAG: hypothetical protein OEW30_18625 [Acidimicrobiia bacterium]|nr:hypothetical protein [Acidimicrobiia bacterium]
MELTIANVCSLGVVSHRWRRFDVVEALLPAARVQEISVELRRPWSRRRRVVTADELRAAVETMLAAVEWTDRPSMVQLDFDWG